MELTDPFDRRLSYLRLSVTDLCNYRCAYCLPRGYQGKKEANELSLPEITHLVSVFAQNGTRKIRLTGGEPTLRKDLTDIIAICKAQPEIQSIALTTNAYRLLDYFPRFQAAGLDKLNISLDSFDAQTFYRITGKDEAKTILRDVDFVLESGFYNLKINTLLLKEQMSNALQDALNFIRSRPISLRFIELMQTGENHDFFRQHHLAGEALEKILCEQGWQRQEKQLHAGPAREFKHPDYAGSIGIIAPYQSDFCQACNRLRVSAQGKMHLCLFGGIAYDLRPFLNEARIDQLSDYLHQVIQDKPEKHYLHDKKFGLINNLSIIGG